MAKRTETKEKTPEELRGMLEDLSKEIYNFQNDLRRDRKLKHPHLLRIAKRNKARILTLLNQQKEKSK